MIYVEEDYSLECDKCHDWIYPREKYYLIGFHCKCGEYTLMRICKRCMENAEEVND